MKEPNIYLKYQLQQDSMNVKNTLPNKSV